MNSYKTFIYLSLGVFLGIILTLGWVYVLNLRINQENICFSKEIGEYLIRSKLGI